MFTLADKASVFRTVQGDDYNGVVSHGVVLPTCLGSVFNFNSSTQTLILVGYRGKSSVIAIN